MRRRQVGLRPFHELFDRQIGGEREAKFLAKLLHPEPEIAVRARKQIFLQPLPVFVQRNGGFLLKRRELLFHFRRAIEQRIETFAHKADRPLHLIDRRLGVNLRRMLQIRLRLRDDGGNCLHPFAQIRDAFFGRREIAGDEQVEAVSQALVVGERVPILLLQFFEIEDLVIDAVFQNAQVDAVRRVQLGVRTEAIQFFAKRPGVGQSLRSGFGRIIGQPIVEAMIAQLRRLLRIRLEVLLDVFAREFLEPIVVRRGKNGPGREKKAGAQCDQLDSKYPRNIL